MGFNLGTAIGYLELNTDRWVSGFNTAREQMQTLADSSQSMSSRFQSAGSMLSSMGSTLSTHVTLPLAAVGAASLKTAVDFESAFTGVRKTVDATETQYKQLETAIRNMSKEMPQSASQIATVAEAAGQLGIKREDVIDFTKVMVELGDTTNLSSEEAASALAQFANVTGMSMDNVDRLGSTIVALGNNLATTESAVVDMGQRMASVGSQIKMSEAEILSWAGAMSSVGISSEIGGSSFSKFAKDVQLAVDTGSSKLKLFAEVAGVSSNEFAKAFKENASNALQMFIEGLSKSEERGTSVTAVLDKLGYTEVGMSQTLSSLAGGYDTLNKALDVGSNAWKDNTALAKEAETRYQTTESRLLMLKNQFQDLGISVGQILLPFLESFMEKLSAVAEWLASLNEETLKIVVGIGAVAASIGPLLLILGSLASAIGSILELKELLSGISLIQKMIGGLSSIFTVISGIITGTVIPALSSLWAVLIANPIGLIVAAIAALVAVFVVLWNKNEAFRNFFIDTWNNIKEFASNTIQAIKDKLSEWGQSLVEFVTTTIPNWVNSIGEWFNELPERIGLALGTALGNIASWIVNTWNYFTTNIPLWIESIGQWFSELPGRVWTWLTSTYNKATTWGSQMASKAKEAGSNFIKNTINFIQQLPSKVWNWLSQTIQKTIKFASDFAEKGRKAASDFKDKIVAGVKTIPSKMVSIGKDIVKGIWSGITGMGSWLKNQISSFASGVVKGFQSSFKIHSPSQIMRDLIGANLIKGIGVGIESEEGNLLDMAKNIAANLVNTMSGNINMPDLFNMANGLTNSMSFAGAGAITNTSNNESNINISINNPVIYNHKDIESIADELAFYLKRKGF